MTTTTEAPARAVESVTSVLSVSIQPNPKSVAALFLELQAAGIVPTVTPDGRGLAVPAGKLSPELRARVVAHKAALIDYLTQPRESVMSVLSVSNRPNPKSVADIFVPPVAPVQATAPAPAWVAPALAPDPGMAPLLALAMTYCNHTGASDKARADWHADIEATPVEQRGELAAHLRSQLPAPSLKAMPPAVVASPSPPAPAQTWREADKADQLHYWGCAQCLPVVKTGTGKRCTTGQQLHDAYMDAATREGRFIGAAPDPAKPLPKFHHAQPWRAIDRELQAHHWSCAVCKAAARGHSERCPTGQHQHGLYESFVNAP